MTDLTVPALRSQSIPEGTRYWGDPVNAAGEVNVAGELSTDHATALEASWSSLEFPIVFGESSTFEYETGHAEAEGSADLSGELGLTATGRAEAVGSAAVSAEHRLGRPVRLTVDAGTTETIAEGDALAADEVNLGGELNVAGTLNAGYADAPTVGIAEAYGDATVSAELALSATGYAELVATADLQRRVPLWRVDRTATDMDRTDRIPVDADRTDRLAMGIGEETDD